MKNKTAIVIPDTHVPFQDKKAVNCVMKAIKLVQPDTLIHLGDIGEWDNVSYWKYKKKKRPPVEYIIPEVEKDVADVNTFLDKIETVLPGKTEKYLMLGNHELWLDNFCEEHPYLVDKFLPQNCMRLEQRAWKWFKYGQFLKIGELYFHHGGQYKGIHHARNTVLTLHENIVYGHFHDVQRFSVSSLKGVHTAISLGCLKQCEEASNEWLKGKKTNWSHAFGVVNWDTQGIFGMNVIDITAGKCWVYGKQIKG